MAIEALCPTCGAIFNLKDEYEGKKVRCKKCEQIFTVNGEKAAARDDGVKSKADAAPTKKSARDDDDDEERSSRKVRTTAKRGRDDDDDDRPKKKASRRGRDDDDDDDDKSRKRKRTYHDDDDDDDDDDRPRKGAPQRSGGGSGKVLAIVGVSVALVLLICGGAVYGVYRLVANVEEAAEAQQQDWQNAVNNGGNPWAGFPGGERQPKDMAEALTNLKSNDAGDRRGAANWLASQPLDAGKQKEVATALEALVKESDDNNCAAGAKAMKVWGTNANGPALTTALRSRLPGQNRPFLGEDQKQLMGAIAAVKYEPGAEVITEFLGNFFSGGEAEAALGNFGAGAERPVLKCYYHPDGNVRGKAQALCVRYGTKPLVILDQTVIDLGSTDRGRGAAALEWLALTKSNEALQATKADPARRNAVALAMNKVIDDPQANGGHVLDASKRWATAANVPAIIRKLEADPWNKKGYGDVLIAIGPACEPEVKQLLNHRDGGVAAEAKRVLAAVGSPESRFEAVLADLKSDNAGRIRDAARSLQTTPVDEKQRAQVVAALVDTMTNTGPGRTDGDCAFDVVKATVVWATKDDAGAIADKLRTTIKPFTRDSRKLLIEWMGKQKAEKAIPFLASALTDRDDYQNASKALQAMGPERGDKIEGPVSNVNTTDANQLLECFKILGAVGTAKSLPLLKTQQTLFLQQKKLQLAQACKDAADAITLRGK